MFSWVVEQGIIENVFRNVFEQLYSFSFPTLVKERDYSIKF